MIGLLSDFGLRKGVLSFFGDFLDELVIFLGLSFIGYEGLLVIPFVG